MTDLNNINIEPDMINDIRCLVEHASPKRVNQRKYEENLIKAGYSIGIGEMTETKQMTKQNQQPEIIEIGGVKYQRVKEPEPKTLKELFEIYVENAKVWAQSEDVIAQELVDIVKEFIPKPMMCDNNYDAGYNYAIKKMEKNLK